MSDNIKEIYEDEAVEVSSQEVEVDSLEVPSGSIEYKFKRLTSSSADKRNQLTGMYKEWFLDYASYVILERAVPHLEDGLKPVQRRILHSMKRMDDGRYNKVANIIGNTMQFHPHGDSSIGGALVQLGQKDLLIDCQGNWGNIYTGDSSAAPRYIEARLSKFALDVVFNPKTTDWMLTYDGRNKEPVTLPVKFPLLLAQGGEGIAVGLASKILPHNFIELIDSSIMHLRGESFDLFPDFITGGFVDVSRYNDGARGGSVKIRSRIIKIDKNTLSITEIPFGKNTTSIIESIIKANEKSKIKIKRVDDNTAEHVEILIHLTNDVSADKTIDALYAFTDCEISISTNACVITENKPIFTGVSDILRIVTDQTKRQLGKELELRLSELTEDWHLSSLEKIFIEKRIYRGIEESESWEEVVSVIYSGLEPYKNIFYREINDDDIVRLTEIKIKRISKYDERKADDHIAIVEAEMVQVKKNLENLNDYTIDYYKRIRKNYSKGKERRTEIRNFSSIEATQVAVANAKLYVNRAEGFYGMGGSMKKEEFVYDCSDIDDVIVFTRDGRYIITRVADKAYFDKDIINIGIFKRNDERTIYNVIYRDGETGAIHVKRCAIKGITRDKVYNITKGSKGSEVLYMSVNENGEAEVLKIYLKPRPRLKKLIVDLDFSQHLIKGRASQGNTFSRFPIHKITLKSKGVSTLSGQDVWFDSDINKLNSDGIGELLGEFRGDDKIVVFTLDGTYYTSGYELNQYFPEGILRVEKYDSNRVYSVTYFDGSSKYFYVKRFIIELSEKHQYFIDESPSSYLVEINSDCFPNITIDFGGANASRLSESMDVDSFIGVKSHRAKGKRVTIYTVGKITFVEPLRFPEVIEAVVVDDEDELDEEMEVVKVKSLFDEF